MPPALGDSFPESVKNEFANRNLKIGNVIKCLLDTIKNPKQKRVVIIGFTADDKKAGMILCNTEKPNIPAISEYQIHLNSDERDYLEHGSYFNCSEIHPFKTDILKLMLKSNPEAHLGKMSEADLDLIKDAAANARTISLKEKRQYGIEGYIRT